MAKPKSKDADRRAVVEQMRKAQQRKEKRQGLLLIGVAVLVGAVIIGFAVVQVLKSNEDAGRPLADIGASSSSAGCRKVVTEKAAGNNDHRPEGERILYEQNPPAAGPHYGSILSGVQARAFYTAEDRPPVEQLVHNLEHGYAILWYDETIADDEAQLADVQAIAKRFGNRNDFEDKFIAAPWTSEDGNGEALPDGAHVALTHWSLGGTNGNPEGQLGVSQYCEGVSGEAVEDFMADYPYSDAPEGNLP